MPGCYDKTQTFTLTEVVLTAPPIASVTVSPEYAERGTMFFIDGSGSLDYAEITLTSGDGRSTTGSSTSWAYAKSGKYTATAYVTGLGTDSDEFDFLVYDQTYETVAWTTVPYRYTPNIPLGASVTFTLKDKASGATSTMLSWNETERCVTGTPQIPNIGRTYIATLAYGNTTITWDIAVGAATTTVPVADFTATGKGLDIELTLSTNMPETTAMLKWTIRNKATNAMIMTFKDFNPSPKAVPSAGMYTVTLEMSTSSGSITPVTKDVYVSGATTPPVEADETAPKIACYIIIVLGVLILIIGAIFMKPVVIGFGMLLVVAGLVLFAFIDTSLIDDKIYEIYKR
jgi:hypothetical protein